MLTLSEELFLISMTDKHRSVAIPKDAVLPYSLAGAMLYELISRDKIALGEDNRLRVIDESPTVDERLNKVIRNIQAAEKPPRLAHWIGRVGSKPKKMYSALVLNLMIKGILKEEEKRFLWVIPYRMYSELGGSAKFWRKQQLRSAVLAGERIDEQSVALLGLLRACGLVDQVFTKDEIKTADRRISGLIQDCAKENPRLKILEEIAGTAVSIAKEIR
jgi:hypothetical protein